MQKCFECGKKASWKAIGLHSRFGVPLESFHCDTHKEQNERNPRPKIMNYNRFEVEWINIIFEDYK